MSSATANRRPLPVKPALVRVPLHPYALEDEPRIVGGAIVYLLDLNEVAYLCEARPSYYLLPVRVELDYAEGVGEEGWEELAEEGWEDRGGAVYMHVSDVERLGFHELGPVDLGDLEDASEDEARREVLEEVLEDEQANHTSF